MTTISKAMLIALTQTQPSLARLAVGAKLLADVIGPTRNGLSVRVGHESFFLQVKSALPEAKNLTLQIIDVKRGTDHRVQILASNDRLLPKPILAELTPRPITSEVQPTSVTIAEDSSIDVTAQPVTRDGKALGPTLVVRLTTQLLSQPQLQPQPQSQPILKSDQSRASTGLPTPNEQSIATTGKSVTVSASGKPTPLPVTPTIETRSARSTPVLPSRGEVKVTPAPYTQPPHPKTGLTPATTNFTQNVIPPREAGETVIATVIGRSPGSGQVFLQTPDLLMKIEQPIDLPLGTTLQITLLTKPIPYDVQPDPNLSTDESSPLTRLIELLDAIGQPGQTVEESGGPSGPRQLPLPERDLAVKLLLLINLQTGHPIDEAGMMAHDQDSANFSKTRQIRNLLSEIGSSASEPLADGWRSITLPLGPDPAQALIMFHREHYSGQESDEADSEVDDVAAQRAVFDINFSRLGRCQIDVLCQHQRFDLLVRSEKSLDAEDQQEITNLFSSACEIAGLSGDIGYRHGQFVEPAKMAAATKSVTT